MSFRKEDIPTQPNNISYYPGTNLGNQGALCADVVACNSTLNRVIYYTNITSFTTAELESCEYCPIRKFDRTNNVVTDELGISISDKNNIFFRTNGTVPHTQITDGGFYVLTPYIPATPAWTQNVFFRKEPSSDKFKIITGGVLLTVGAKSLVPFIPLSKSLKHEYTRVPEVKYSIRLYDGREMKDVPEIAGGISMPYNNSFTYTINPGKFAIIPCDYVDDGFLFQNEQGKFISFNNGTVEEVQSPLKYSEEYNKCVFFIKPSSRTAFMAQYRPSGEYYSSGMLAQGTSLYNSITSLGYSIDPSYFTDYVTERRYKYTGTTNSNKNAGYMENFQAPVYYVELATVDPELMDPAPPVVTSVNIGGGGYPGVAVGVGGGWDSGGLVG
jgi:hypothetical protein